MPRLVSMTCVALAGVLVACGMGEMQPVDESPTGWQQLPPSPLTPRERATAAWTGEETVILGGSDAIPCPPWALCLGPVEPPLRDGAAFDPDTEEWRSIPDAPTGISDATTALAQGDLFVLSGGQGGAGPAFLAYRVDENRWDELPLPSQARSRRIVEADGNVIAFSYWGDESGTTDDLMFDPAEGRWQALPDDPLGPAYTERRFVWSGAELILIAKDLEFSDGAGSRSPSLAEAAALDLESGRWRRLPASEIIDDGGGWFAAEAGLVNPAPGTADGGGPDPGDWGRTYPFGGVLLPDEGTWADLPKPPREAIKDGPYGSGVLAGDVGHYFAATGWILDAETSDWIEIPRFAGSLTDGQATANAGRAMIVFGGAEFDSSGEGRVIDDGWIWTPPEATD